MGNRSGIMMKLAIALAIIAASSAAPVTDRQINDQKAVDEINALPDLLWTAGKNSRFNGQSLSSFKDLAGVKSDSLEQVLALPKAESTLTASDVPAEFDSETNWPQCAKVIEISGTNPTADVAGHSPELLLRRTVCASLPTARSLYLFQLKTFASVPAPTVAVGVKSPLHGRLSRKAVLSLVATTMPLELSAADSAKLSRFLIATTTALKEMTHTQQRAPQAAHLNTQHRAHAHATQTPKHPTTTLPLTNGLSAVHLADSCLAVAVAECSTRLAKQASRRPSWREVQSRLPSLCTPTSPTTRVESTTTSVEASRAAMPCALLDGVSMEATTIGRLPTLGTLTGARRDTSGSSAVAMNVESRTVSPSQQPQPSGVRKSRLLLPIKSRMCIHSTPHSILISASQPFHLAQL